MAEYERKEKTLMIDSRLELLIQALQPLVKHANKMHDIINSKPDIDFGIEAKTVLNSIANVCNIVLDEACSPSPYRIDMLIDWHNLMSAHFSEVIQKIFQKISKSSAFVPNEYVDFVSSTELSDDSISFSKNAVENLANKSDSKLFEISSKSDIISLPTNDFFITILIPILISLFTMMHSQYLSDSNSRELERINSKNASFQEQILEIELNQMRIQEEIASYFRDISISLESLASHEDNPEDFGQSPHKSRESLNIEK